MGSASLSSVFEQTSELLTQATAGCAAEEWSYAPPRKWAIGQIVEHLGLTYARTREGLERVLATDRLPTRRRSLGQSVALWYYLTFAHSPIRAQAPEGVIPGANPPSEAALESALAGLQALKPLTEQAQARFGTRSVLVHPFFGPISAAQVARFHWVHTKHHVRQIRERRRAFVQRG